MSCDCKIRKLTRRDFNGISKVFNTWSVSPIWLENNFEDKIAEVNEALDALWELYELSKRLAVENNKD